MQLTSSEEIAEKWLQTHDLHEFFNFWDDVTREDVDSLRAIIDSAKKEQDLQELLEQHPKLLIQHLSGGHGRWVIPQKRLGSEYATDFIIGELDSMGYHWTLVELEPATTKLFKKNGDPTARLSHAIGQIQDWRIWLNKNQNYAARNRSESGLGLTDITSTAKGLILIGRRENLEQTRDRRRQMSNEHKIEIHTYDWLVENAEGRLRTFRK